VLIIIANERSECGNLLSRFVKDNSSRRYTSRENILIKPIPGV